VELAGSLAAGSLAAVASADDCFTPYFKQLKSRSARRITTAPARSGSRSFNTWHELKERKDD
jgi:hypothetical protein